MIKLKDLNKIIVNSYKIISLINEKGKEIVIFNDYYYADNEEDLEKIITEFGECEVIYILASSDECLEIEVKAEY